MEYWKYPETFDLPTDDRIRHPEVFDPALKQFHRAFRRGEPVFDNPEIAVGWRAVRRRAMERAAGAIARSRWGDMLVLRGSLVLKAWFGDAAREPGDMDWVVVPQSIKVEDAAVREMFAELPGLIAQSARDDGFEWVPSGAKWDDIWTYDRAPGRRLVLPWR